MIIYVWVWVFLFLRVFWWHILSFLPHFLSRMTHYRSSLWEVSLGYTLIISHYYASLGVYRDYLYSLYKGYHPHSGLCRSYEMTYFLKSYILWEDSILLSNILFDEEKYHFSKCLDRYSHKEKTEYAYNKVRPCFSEFFDSFSTEHDDQCSDQSGYEYRDHAIHYTISMHCDDIRHPRSRKGEWKSKRDDESLIEVFMDEMISLYCIDLRSICLFSLHHRECYKKEDDRSSNTKILSFESEKCEHILPKEKCPKHRYEENESKACSIFSVFFRCSTWMKFRIEWKCRKWFKEGNKWEHHYADQCKFGAKTHVKKLEY